MKERPSFPVTSKTMRFPILLGFLAIPLLIDADMAAAEDISPERQAYRERMKARRAEALAARAERNARKPRAVYNGPVGGFSSPGLGPQVEMVYSVSQGRLVPSQFQRVKQGTGFGGGFSQTVVRTKPATPYGPGLESSSGGLRYGDRFRKNRDGSITVLRNGVPVGNLKNGRLEGKRK